MTEKLKDILDETFEDHVKNKKRAQGAMRDYSISEEDTKKAFRELLSPCLRGDEPPFEVYGNKIVCGEITLALWQFHADANPWRLARNQWQIVRECPHCGEAVYSAPCSSLEEVSVQYAMHDADFFSEHKCEEQEETVPLQPPKKPTRHEQVLTALYEIANAVRCLADRI
jgi:hypothetical protein